MTISFKSDSASRTMKVSYSYGRALCFVYRLMANNAYTVSNTQLFPYHYAVIRFTNAAGEDMVVTIHGA